MDPRNYFDRLAWKIPADRAALAGMSPMKEPSGLSGASRECLYRKSGEHAVDCQPAIPGGV